ncbi:Trm112 family protein [Methanocaldococcus sp.]|nr:Trm112 family protein [Methanocaldococcus sp.]MCQ6253390.1 Trm112 family protein [Methanocaldococcus sp.]
MNWIEKYIEIFQCPYCKGDIYLNKDKLICKKCKRVYEIIEGIPVLLRY